MTEAGATDPVETTKPLPSPSSAELQRDIEQTRDELAATVAALAAKVNVPARVREKLSRMRMRGRGRTREGAYIVREREREITGVGAYFTRQGVTLAVAVAAAAVVGWVLIRRKRG
ncbi:MAG TPA: DUF3618 domain-containing protein [Actinomycetes bacterium]